MSTFYTWPYNSLLKIIQCNDFSHRSTNMLHIRSSSKVDHIIHVFQKRRTERLNNNSEIYLEFIQHNTSLVQVDILNYFNATLFFIQTPLDLIDSMHQFFSLLVGIGQH